MKKRFIYLLFVNLLVLGSACKKPLKNVEDYFPKLKTVSAIVQANGSVMVTGEIESPGKTPGIEIEYVGFCMNITGDPKILDAQLMSDLSGKSFSAIFPADLFNANSAFYFRSWATNEFGYSYGEVIKLDSIIAPNLTPPCTLKENMLNLGASTTPEEEYTSFSQLNGNSFSGYGTSHSISFIFGSELTTRIFKTTFDPMPEPGQVKIMFTAGSLENGSNVYVNRVNATTFEITVCDAPWMLPNSSKNSYFNTRFKVNF